MFESSIQGVNTQVIRFWRHIVRRDIDISSRVLTFLLFIFSLFFLVLFLVLLEPFYFHSDDAFITYNFARNLANGFGIVFHPEFEPIQGSSSFLYTVLLAGFAKTTTVDVHIIGSLFSVFSYIGFLVVIVALIGQDSPRISNRTKLVIFAMSFSFQLPLLLSYGLEITFISALLILTLYLIASNKIKWASFILLLIPLTRLDYLFYFPSIAIFFYIIVSNWRKTITFFIPSMISTITYLLFSRFYFGEFIPYSWIAKAKFPTNFLATVSWRAFFEKYPLTLVLIITWMLLAVYVLIKEWHSLKTINNLRKKPAFVSLVLFGITSFLYTCLLGYVGAPNMPWYFVTPFCFFYAMVAYIVPRINGQLGKLLSFTLIFILNIFIFVSISQSFITGWSNYTVNRLGHNDRREKIGLWLQVNIPDISHKTILCYEVGKIPYFSGAKAYDTLALVSREGIPGLEKSDATITFLHINPDFVAGPNLASYFPMTFLSSKEFSNKYKKVYQVDDYVLWQRRVD